MLHKACPAEVKAIGVDDGLAEGQFRAVVSVFGNKDSYGDKVMPGAFADDLARWAAKGTPIPVFWSHQMHDPDMCIGHVIEAKETAVGLEVLAQLDLDGEGPTKAKSAHRLLQKQLVTQFSFAYDIVEAAWVETEDEWWYELRKLKLHEVGPTPIGANQETELLAVKSAAEKARHLAADVNVGLKAGRELSAKNESMLSDVADALDASSSSIRELLTAVGGEASNDEKARTGEPAKDERPRAKSEEPTQKPPSDPSALLSIEIATAAI